METRPQLAIPPAVDHEEQSKLAGQVQAMLARRLLMPMFDSGKHLRAGITKNKMQGESKTRRKMAKESRRRNR